MLASVIVPAFNAGQSLERAVESALAQSVADIEVIVVDDGSTDQTRSVAEALAKCDPRVRVLALPANGGVSAARNAGIAAARGEWIALLDADDAFLPDRLQRLVGAAVSRSADIAVDDIFYFDWSAQETAGTGMGRC